MRHDDDFDKQFKTFTRFSGLMVVLYGLFWMGAVGVGLYILGSALKVW